MTNQPDQHPNPAPTTEPSQPLELMTPTGRVFITPTPSDPPGVLNALHRDDLSVVHLHARVSDTKLAHAAMSMLWALGKREEVTGTHGHHSENVPLATVWLTAHRTRVLIISHPQRWHPKLLLQTLRLAIAAGTNTVLAPTPDNQAATLDAAAGLTPTPLPLEQLTADLTLDATPTTTTHDTHDWSTTPVPEVDWPTYRHECRNVLPDGPFHEADRVYRHALTTARNALATDPERDEDNTRHLLVTLLEPTNHSALATTALRAAQAAHFQAGYNLRIDPNEAIAQLSASRSATLSDQDWSAIRAYREPTRAATCALYGLGYSVEQIEAFTLGEADHLIQTNTHNNKPLHPEAAAILRAARLERSLEHATPNEPLLDRNTPAAILNHAAKDLGLIVPTLTNRRSLHTLNQWRYRLGFSIKKIAKA